MGGLPMFARNSWYIAAWGDEVGDAPLARRICNDPVVLFRGREGRAAALADLCCHRAAPLSRGTVVEQGIQCGYHGLIIDSAGKCVKVPGQRLIPGDAAVKSYPLVEKNQLIWVWMGDPSLADPATIVDFPYHDTWPNKHACYPIRGNYMLMVDNLMDLTHLGYLHAKTVGGNPGQHVDAEMRQVHQIVDHQHVIAPDRVAGVLVRPGVVIGEIDDRRRVGQRRIAHPHPDELVLLDQRIAFHRGVAGNEALARHLHAFARAVDDEPVIAALDALLDDRAAAKRRGAVAAAVGERGGAALLVADRCCH